MKKLTIIFISLLFFSASGQSQSGGASTWLSFVIQVEGREASNTSWMQAERLEVNKRIGPSALNQNNTAGLIRFDPREKEVRFTFANFTVNGGRFSPSEMTVEYQEDGRMIGPIKALPGPANSDYYQLTLRFREKTARAPLSIRLTGRTSGQFIKDTINTLLVWGKGDAEPADFQVSYLDTRETTARSPYPTAMESTQARAPSASTLYTIQLGAYTVLPDRREFSAAAPYGQVYSRRIGSLNYVRVGPYQDAGLAQQYLQRIRPLFPEAYIVIEDQAQQPLVAPSVTNPTYGETSAYGPVAPPRLPATEPAATKGTSSTYRLPEGITGYAIQLASYKKEDNAVAFIERLRERGVSDAYVWIKGENNRAVIAPFPSKSSAASYLQTLKQQYNQDGIVTYIE